MGDSILVRATKGGTKQVVSGGKVITLRDRASDRLALAAMARVDARWTGSALQGDPDAPLPVQNLTAEQRFMDLLASGSGADADDLHAAIADLEAALGCDSDGNPLHEDDDDAVQEALERIEAIVVGDGDIVDAEIVLTRSERSPH